MKLFPWLLALAFGVVCLAAWGMSELVARSLENSQGALPVFTRLVVLPRHTWLLFAPLPWFVYAAVLSFRKESTAAASFIFAGTLFLFAALVVSAVTVALCLPFIPLRLHA